MNLALLHKTSSFVSKSPILRAFRPGWIDEARLIIQVDIFRKLAKDAQFYGICLNAGCGEGLYSEFLESFQDVSEIINLDLELPSIPERRVDTRHKAKQGSLTCLPFSDATFDCCLCSEVVEHINNDVLAVLELGRVIKPGGYLLISVPTPPAPYDSAHVREGYTLNELSKLLMKSGFIVKCHMYCFHIFMRFIYSLWQWQFVSFGKEKRNYLPRFIVLAFGYLDKHLKLGKPWDLVILAQKLI